VCLHGHFYQPPREDPWLGVVEPQASAAPDHDWNARVTRECYKPMAAARVLDGRGRLQDVVDLYEWLSFNVGPTLLAWMQDAAPDLLAAIRRADAAGLARTGQGNAWAQVYGHPILPLSTPRDAATQVRWGRRDFEHRFGRAPEGMWLPEMAVDVKSLSALADAGISLTLLSPHQARRVRPIGSDAGSWGQVTPATLDTGRLYRCSLPEGRTIDVVFRDAALSHDLSFGDALRDGARLAERLAAGVRGDEDALLTVAVDGETFGHHHRFGEMALAFAVRALRRDPDLLLCGPAAFRARVPVTHEVEIVPETSWSCPHGIERWRHDCGCHTGGQPGWTQAWRSPLRQAIDWLRDELAVVYETRAIELVRDPWGARDRYVDCLLDPSRTAAFLTTEAGRRLSPGENVMARRCFELARHALLMQTSCGWFFDDLAGLEPIQVLRHAARAVELAGMLGRRLEDGFVARLEPARSNRAAEGNGADVWRRHVRRHAATPARVAGTSALLAMLRQDTRLPGYEVAFSSEPTGNVFEAEVRVVERATEAATTLDVKVERVGGGAPWCEAGGERFTLDDLFGVQRERLLAAVTRETSQGARDGRAETLAHVRPLLEPLLAGEGPLPPELALLLGWHEADAIATALEASSVPVAQTIERVTALRARGVTFPGEWLAGRLARVLEDRVGALPGGAADALALLDLAAAAGAELPAGAAQVRVLEWRRDAPPAVRADPVVVALCERLRLADD
jgi:alpha-amylase/alpha-mannosidase (GH57 family)